MSEQKNYYINDFADPNYYIEAMSKKGLSNFPPLIITCAITGSNQGKEANPNLPETADEQVQQAYEAYKAGASVIHIHRRSSANNAVMTKDYKEYVEVNQRIRELCPDVIINNTAGGGRVMTPSGEVGPIMDYSLDAYPEVASFDTSCFPSRKILKKRLPPLTGRDEDTYSEYVYGLSYTDANNFLKKINENDIKPEYECYDLGDLNYLKSFIAEGKVKGPHIIQMVLGGRFNYPTPDFMSMVARSCPKESVLGFILTGPIQFPLLPVAIALGANVRVGMEDNIYIERGKLADSNAQLVEKAVRIAKEMGRPIATPAQAREMMGLGAPRQYPYK